MTNPLANTFEALREIRIRMHELGFHSPVANFLIHSDDRLFSINLHCSSIEGRRLGDMGLKIFRGSTVDHVFSLVDSYLDSLPDEKAQARQDALQQMDRAVEEALQAGAEPGRLRDMILTRLIPNDTNAA